MHLPSKLGRREFISAAVATLLAPLPGRSTPTQPRQAPVVSTSLGKVSGLSVDGVLSYRGLPYAAPTSGSSRFLPPQPPKKWRGIRDCSNFGPPCFQPADADVDTWHDKVQPSEDCLRLNIWTPGVQPGRRPVMVWLHGGANINGSGALPGYDGASLASDNDVVIVTLNYRLNVFGFLYLGGFDERYAAGNVALLDMVAALHWIKENVEAFGGDPTNVTLFGQSSGGACISALLAMTPARGFFHKAIIQSGARPTVASLSDANQTAERLFQELGLPVGKVQQLQKVAPRALLAAYMKARTGRTILYKDGVTLLREPFEPAAPTESSDVPLLISTTEDEMAEFLFFDRDYFDPGLNDAALASNIVHYNSHSHVASESKGLWLAPAQALTEAVSRVRLENSAMSRWAIASRVLTCANHWRNALFIAQQRVESSAAPTYLCEFRWKVPGLGGLYAFHTVDLPLVFGHPNAPLSPDGADTAEAWRRVDPNNRRASLAREVGRSWAAFARNGDPTTADLPKWPAYDSTRRATMIFDYDPFIVDDPRGKLRTLFSEGPSQAV